MTNILLILSYCQFINEYIFLFPRNPYITYVITAIIFVNVILYVLTNVTGKIDKTLFAYFICISLMLINASFIASVNILGFMLYIRRKRNISINNLRYFFFLINIITITVLIFRINTNPESIKVLGTKLNKDMVVHGFNNTNTEAEFYYFVILSVWLLIKNKYFRNILVLILTIIAFQLTAGRTYLLASASLVLFDVFISKKNIKYCKAFLISVPIITIVLSFVIGYFTRNMSTVVFFDQGLAGRFFVFGYIIKNLDLFKFFFGFKEIKTGDYVLPLDVSVFAIFATRGIVMLLFFLTHYIAYIKIIRQKYIKYIPLIASLVVGGVALPMLAWFSINMIIFLCFLEHNRKINNEFYFNHRPRL